MFFSLSDNIFFKSERKKMVAEINAKNKGKFVKAKSPDFSDLAKKVAARWRTIDPVDKLQFEKYAALDKVRYHREMMEWRQVQKAKPQMGDAPKHDSKAQLRNNTPSLSSAPSTLQQPDGNPIALKNSFSPTLQLLQDVVQDRAESKSRAPSWMDERMLSLESAASSAKTPFSAPYSTGVVAEEKPTTTNNNDPAFSVIDAYTALMMNYNGILSAHFPPPQEQQPAVATQEVRTQPAPQAAALQPQPRSSLEDNNDDDPLCARDPILRLSKDMGPESCDYFASLFRDPPHDHPSSPGL